MRSGSASRLSGLRALIEDLAWRLRHPGTRRCPRCRLTWESRKIMNAHQGGVCHDCHGHDLTRDLPPLHA